MDDWYDDDDAVCECCDEVRAPDEMADCAHCESYVCPDCANADGDDVIPDTCQVCNPCEALHEAAREEGRSG